MIGIKRKEESVLVTSIETVITEFDKKKIQVKSLFIECGMSTILVVRSKCVSWKIRVHFISLEPTPPTQRKWMFKRDILDLICVEES